MAVIVYEYEELKIYLSRCLPIPVYLNNKCDALRKSSSNVCN